MKRLFQTYRMVHKELTNANWIRNLRNLNSEALIEEFVLLFAAISDIQLTQQKDKIKWRWTQNGVYTTTSAYQVQFYGSYPDFTASTLWQTRTEPKCRFFAWLAAHDRVQTADNLARKNWPHNPTCSLCYCQPETTNHLLTECNFTEATWDRIATILQIRQPVRLFNKGE